MQLAENAKLYLDELKEKWLVLHDTPGIFAYKLNVKECKFLMGKQQFYSELNPERSALRRPPQVIPTLKPIFDDAKFNFLKINPQETIMQIPYGDNEIAMIINNSPLTLYHTLICPDLAGKLAQFLTPICLNFSVDFLLRLEDKAWRIGYNSPGALASVNHLHLHLMHIETELYIDKAKLMLLKDRHIYRLSPDMPTEGICFLISVSDSAETIDLKLRELYNFILWLCEENMPHNLFITHAHDDFKDTLKVFVYARDKYCEVKDLMTYNFAFCEFSGFLPIGDQTIYDELTEEQVLTKMHEEIGATYQKIYQYFTK